ncbi:MAG TPA: EAL domain-containing protein [Rectinemataceae bacterium]
MASEAIMLARSAESLLYPEHIEQLEGNEKDLGKAEYSLIKRSLSNLIATDNPIHFAYLMRMVGDTVIFLVDSEDPASPDMSPPGQVYSEADEPLKDVFRKGVPLLSKPSADRWGTWRSAIVPVRNRGNGPVDTVFGIDYSASEWTERLWNKMIPDIAIAAGILILCLAWLNARFQRSALKSLSERLALSEALYRSIFEQAPIGIAMADDTCFHLRSEFGFKSVNPAFEKILQRSQETESSVAWASITHPEDLQADLENYLRFKSGEIPTYTMEKRFLRPDGTYVWTQMTISHLLDVPQSHSLHLCLLEDISARKEIEDSLKESERSKSVLLSNLPGMAYRCENDEEWTMRYVSAGCQELTGYQPESLIGNRDISFNDIIVSEYKALLREKWTRILAEKKPFRHEYEIKTADGKRKWVLELGQGVYNAEGGVEALEGIILDISDRKKNEDALLYMSEHDTLTGLRNLKSLQDCLLKPRLGREPKRRALVCVNVSSIHELNLRYGFKYGEELIKRIANILAVLSGPEAQLFHIYQFKFAYCLENYADRKALERFCSAISETVSELLGGERIAVGIGVVEIAGSKRLDIDTILKTLHIASERNLDSTRNGISVCFYDEKLESEISREEALGRELADIVAGRGVERLKLRYQPILDLETKKICGFEVLPVLKTEAFGTVLPEEFIPIAEKTRIAISLGTAVFSRAMNFLNTLDGRGLSGISLEFSVSATQLLNDGFADILRALAERMHVDTRRIILDITELFFASNMADVNTAIRSLKAIGVQVALDNFGKEYLSLAREREIEFDYIKTDQNFTERLRGKEAGVAVTGEIISIGHKLKHRVVAESVETEDQLRYLEALGCDRALGPLIGSPLDADDALRILEFPNAPSEESRR